MMEQDGVYIVFEGGDFVGKSTISAMVERNLQDKSLPAMLTKHPGATPLGKHLRKLVKQPHLIDKDIEIDPMSAQTLMMIDQICFINTVLQPNLSAGNIVLADRSNFISSIAYGLSEGLKTTTLSRLFQLVDSPPPDRVFILRAPWDVIEKRMGERKKVADRFEDNGHEFLKNVANIYDNLCTLNTEILVLITSFVPLERIVYIDSTKPAEEIAAELTAEVERIATQKLETYSDGPQ